MGKGNCRQKMNRPLKVLKTQKKGYQTGGKHGIIYSLNYVLKRKEGKTVKHWLRKGLAAGLLVLLTALSMFRASGALDALTTLLRPVLEWMGIPPETAPLVLLRPLSGSGGLAVGSDLINTYGPDSAVGRTAAVMLGSSETTFYTIAVYFGAAGIKKLRHTLPAALIADMVGFLAAAWCVKWMF